MHNLHIIVLYSKDYFTASRKALECIGDWGNSNNYKFPAAVLKKGGDFVISETNRWSAKYLETISTPEGVRREFEEYIREY